MTVASRNAGVMTVLVRIMMTVAVVMTVADNRTAVMIVHGVVIVAAVMEVATKAVGTMMIVPGVEMMETMVGALVASPPHMLILLAKSVIFMGIPPRSVGGATVMTVVTMVIMATREQILLPREWIQTGTMIQEPLITSQIGRAHV